MQTNSKNVMDTQIDGQKENGEVVNVPWDNQLIKVKCPSAYSN